MLQVPGSMLQTKGSHLVVDNPELYEATRGSEFFFENKDGRITLILPWHDRVMMGTTDIKVDKTEVVCSDDEIDYIMSIHRRIFPGITVREEDIVFTFSGVRPLPNSDSSKNAAQISRDHSLEVSEPDSEIDFPIVSLIGGKWTSFRAFSEQTTDECLRRLKCTRKTSLQDEPIGGGRNYPQSVSDRKHWLMNVSQRTGVSVERISQLFDTYGTGAERIAEYIAAEEDRPIVGLSNYSHREIMFLAENEMVVHLTDLVLRRTTLTWLGKLTLQALRSLADAVAEALGWSEEAVQTEVDGVINALKKNHRIQLNETSAPSLVT